MLHVLTHSFPPRRSTDLQTGFTGKVSCPTGGENMSAVLALSRVIYTVTTVISKSVSWLLLVAVLVSATNAILRKTLDMSSNAWLEVQWYLFGTVFMLAAAYALLQNEHVRIDVLSSRWTKQIGRASCRERGCQSV